VSKKRRQIRTPCSIYKSINHLAHDLRRAGPGALKTKDFSNRPWHRVAWIAELVFDDIQDCKLQLLRRNERQRTENSVAGHSEGLD